jgi:hypothetical protein
MTSPIYSRKLKTIVFQLDGESFQCQIKSWKLNNNTPTGERLYAFCPDGETFEEGDPDYTLDLTFYSDWRSNGISDFLTAHDQETVDFTLEHHGDEVDGSAVAWNGQVKLMAPSVGGDIRTTEMTEVTLPCIGKPEYAHLGS